MQGDKSGVAEQSASLRMELLTFPPPPGAVIMLTLVQDFFARTHSGPLL